MVWIGALAVSSNGAWRREQPSLARPSLPPQQQQACAHLPWKTSRSSIPPHGRELPSATMALDASFLDRRASTSVRPVSHGLNVPPPLAAPPLGEFLSLQPCIFPLRPWRPEPMCSAPFSTPWSASSARAPLRFLYVRRGKNSMAAELHSLVFLLGARSQVRRPLMDAWIRDAVENRGEKPSLFSMFIFQWV
jgi:hypothetical protein